MKFGKTFKKQQVPEWTEAYADYDGLKQILKKIYCLTENKKSAKPLYRGISGLHLQPGHVQDTWDVEKQVISVDTVLQENSATAYRTKFLPPFEGGEDDILFFRKLDDELCKVNTFYKDKVDEVWREAGILNKQLSVLAALRIKVREPEFDGSTLLRRLSMDIDNSAPVRITSPRRATTSGSGHTDGGPGDMTDQIHLDELFDSRSKNLNLSATVEDLQDNISRPLPTLTHGGDFKQNVNNSADELDPEEVLARTKINKTHESPVSTLKFVLNVSKNKDLTFTKEELKAVEGKLKLLLIEFYRKLNLLKEYSFLNLTAFSKILKKYEKITSRSVSKAYMEIVDNSYLGSSDEVTDLLDKVEATFIKHFSSSNRRKAMRVLRPKQKKEKHSVTFLSGFFCGCSVAILISIILLIKARHLLYKEDAALYINNIFPLYCFYAYIVLHMLMYAANIYFWRRYKVNYPFIFGFKQGTELGFREVFLLSTGLAVLVLSAVLLHLHIKLDSRTQDNEEYIEWVPLGLVIVILAITLCPLNIIYRSSRFFLIKCAFRCLCSPLYKVTLPDFFLADQLTSQVQAIRSFQYYVCYYGSGDVSRRLNRCHNTETYDVFFYIVAVIPHWSRFLQCARRFFDEKDLTHGYNGLRYLLTITAVVIRTAYKLRKGMTWKVLTVVTSGISAIANIYWDIIIDWGLLQRKSRNLLLREKLLVPHTTVYFAAMILDVLLRFAWLQSMLQFGTYSMTGRTISSSVACLEIIRRGMWNFFRLENEHLNNVGKFRAFKTVPLPFIYSEDSDEDSSQSG